MELHKYMDDLDVQDSKDGIPRSTVRVCRIYVCIFNTVDCLKNLKNRELVILISKSQLVHLYIIFMMKVFSFEVFVRPII